MHSVVSFWITLFFVLSPFFALTMFLSMTEGYDPVRRQRLAVMVSVAVAVICLILLFAGRQIFAVFGITLDAFRIGAGTLLLLSAIGLVQGKPGAVRSSPEDDIAVVPLAMPIVVGPATTGTLLVMGAELATLQEKIFGSLALLLAVLAVAAILLAGTAIQRWVGTRGISILSRLTGLILAALAAQMIMTGIQGFLLLGGRTDL